MGLGDAGPFEYQNVNKLGRSLLSTAAPSFSFGSERRSQLGPKEILPGPGAYRPQSVSSVRSATHVFGSQQRCATSSEAKAQPGPGSLE